MILVKIMDFLLEEEMDFNYIYDCSYRSSLNIVLIESQ